jgi:signal transduction histidine kinase
MTLRTAPPPAWVTAAILVVAAALGLWMLVGGTQGSPLGISTILAVMVGWSFVGCGAFLWTRRRVRPGTLMVAFGGLWLLGRSLLLVQQPVLFTAGLWISDLSAAAFALFLLSFPSGRITSRFDRAIAGIFLFVSVPLEFVWLLFYEVEGGLNVLAVAPNATAAQVVDAVQRSALAVAAILLTVSVGRRWLRSSGPVRRQTTPVLVGAVAILLASASWILQPFGITVPELNNLVLAAQFSIPIAILAVLLRARMAKAAVADLVIELGQTPTPARLRDALAQALGDPSLQVAYWSPTKERFEDAAGEPVELPEVGAGQAVTMLERDGVREAAIIHDAILLDDPGLIASVAGALQLAVANDRLTAEVKTQLEEVRASRARIVEAGDLERRRVERDLHDGAQQRLISLSLELRVAQNALGDDADPAVRRSLERAADEATAALAELRDLALGIHPLILTESGLGAAVESLADRSPIDVAVDIGAERYQSAVEGAAYFVISEALANVAKYARATSARVRVRPSQDHMTVEIEDDGVGGADPRSGSGLRGLGDRVAALDGTLTVDSPSGGGTRVRARIPTSRPDPNLGDSPVGIGGHA